MARALVIKNADFSVNKIDTVEFTDIPCTGISLDQSTGSLDEIGDTLELTATVVPANTTDAVIWSSSDNNIAEVAGGVVTQKGCGTVTITATCGSKSATCVITCEHNVDFSHLNGVLIYRAVYDAGCYAGQQTAYNYYASLYTAEKPYPTAKYMFGNATSGYKYGFLIPYGATHVVVNGDQLAVHRLVWGSTKVTWNGQSGDMGYCNGMTDNISSTVGLATVDIPSTSQEGYETMDCVCVSLKNISEAEVTDAMIANATIKFT